MVTTTSKGTNLSTHKFRLLLAGTVALALVAALSLSSFPNDRAEAATTGATITSAWADAKGRSVFIRVGTYNPATKEGFGMTKVIQKHGITAVTTVQFITKNPDGGVAQGLDRKYTGYANKLSCTPTGCTVLQSVPLTAIFSSIVVSSYYGVSIPPGVIGIKTAYCNNSDASAFCPSWVDAAVLNKSALPRFEAGQTTRIVLSYIPMSNDETAP
jgi:hypothetical protein